MFCIEAYETKPQVGIFHLLFYMYSLDAIAIPIAVSFEILASNFQTQYDIDVYFTGGSRDHRLKPSSCIESEGRGSGKVNSARWKCEAVEIDQ